MCIHYPHMGDKKVENAEKATPPNASSGLSFSGMNPSEPVLAQIKWLPVKQSLGVATLCERNLLYCEKRFAATCSNFQVQLY